MDRYPTRQIHDRTPGPMPGAAADGLLSRGVYAGTLVTVPSGGTVRVLLPGLDWQHFYVATCSKVFTGAVGDPVLVMFDDSKHPWVVSPSALATINVSQITGLGSAATQPSSAFDAAGAAATVQAASLQKSNNLSDVASRTAALKNLGIARGNTTVTVAANAMFTIAHGLGAVPAFVGAMALGWSGFVGGYQSPDSTNIYLYASVALSANVVYWEAIL